MKKSITEERLFSELAGGGIKVFQVLNQSFYLFLKIFYQAIKRVLDRALSSYILAENTSLKLWGHNIFQETAARCELQDSPRFFLEFFEFGKNEKQQKGLLPCFLFKFKEDLFSYSFVWVLADGEPLRFDSYSSLLGAGD